MIKMDIKLNDLIRDLNHATKQLSGTKFEDASEMHQLVRQAISPIINAVGLFLTTWDILDEDFNKLISYHIDSQDDRRLKYGRRGRFNTVTFNTSYFVETTDITINEYLRLIAIEKNNDRLKDIERQMEQNRKDLLRLEHEFTKTQFKLQELKKGE